MVLGLGRPLDQLLIENPSPLANIFKELTSFETALFFDRKLHHEDEV